MSELTSDHISHLGRLSRLHLTPEEEARFASQLSSVVGYVEQLSEVDTSSITDELVGVTQQQNKFSEDVARTDGDQCSVSREVLLAGAPAKQGEYIEVRAVMGDEVVSA
ncbi:MAG: gatC [Patescibacteria group bacterium]|jgi:aspartyl-tRNA(Asn)/glutamyl-tRNA(Gln) amidotransferase subunit C|nr:gatC [Patescibacteria group bacterium]